MPRPRLQLRGTPFTPSRVPLRRRDCRRRQRRKTTVTCARNAQILFGVLRFDKGFTNGAEIATRGRGCAPRQWRLRRVKSETPGRWWSMSANSAHKRNGGRHCCQPPLRRAKDLPVFVTWSIEPKRPIHPLSILAHQLRRRFPSCNSLLRGARLIYLTTWPEGSLVFRLARPGTGTEVPAKTARCSAALLGMITTASRFAHQIPRGDPGAASRDRKIISSGASSRLAPTRTRKLSPLPAGGDRTFGHLPPEGGRDRRPDHEFTMHISAESRKQNFR
jgi:hypothetical protein